MPLAKRSLQQENDDQDVRRPRKRERYTRIACESCKSRKVKCSGSLPCGRCAELSAECKYQDYIPQCEARTDVCLGPSPKGAPQQAHEELEQLLSSMRKICDDIQTSTNRTASLKTAVLLLKRRKPLTADPNSATKAYLSSPAHAFDTAKSVLAETGVLGGFGYGHGDTNGLPNLDAKEPDLSTNGGVEAALEATRPVLDLGHKAASAHLTSFLEVVYPAYPCINVHFAKNAVDAIFRTPRTARQACGQDVEMDLIDVEISKVVLAIGMVVADDSPGVLGSDLESHLLWTTDTVVKRDQTQVEDVIVSTLLGIYFSIQGQHVKAWRMTSFATRASLELGMNRLRFYRDCINGPVPLEFYRDLFACVSDLDKRCSFFTSLPCGLHDRDIDEGVLDLRGRQPYLAAMLRLNAVHAELFELINLTPSRDGMRGKEGSERLDYLEFRVQSMEEQILQVELFPAPANDLPLPPTAVRNVMAGVLRMRMTFMRMLAHFRCLRSSSAWTDDTLSAQTLITLAKSLVERYRDVEAAAGPEGISPLWGPLADLILIGAISCMFLAAVYNPAVYGPQCRVSFQTALDLLMASPHYRAGTPTTPWCSLDDLRTISARIQMAPLEGSPTDSMHVRIDDEVVDSMPCETQPPVTDDMLMSSLVPLSNDYLTSLDLTFLGIGGHHRHDSHGPVPFLPLSVHTALPE